LKETGGKKAKSFKKMNIRANFRIVIQGKSTDWKILQPVLIVDWLLTKK